MKNNSFFSFTFRLSRCCCSILRSSKSLWCLVKWFFSLRFPRLCHFSHRKTTKIKIKIKKSTKNSLENINLYKNVGRCISSACVFYSHGVESPSVFSTGHRHVEIPKTTTLINQTAHVSFYLSLSPFVSRMRRTRSWHVRKSRNFLDSKRNTFFLTVRAPLKRLWTWRRVGARKRRKKCEENKKFGIVWVFSRFFHLNAMEFFQMLNSLKYSFSKSFFRVSKAEPKWLSNDVLR